MRSVVVSDDTKFRTKITAIGYEIDNRRDLSCVWESVMMFTDW